MPRLAYRPCARRRSPIARPSAPRASRRRIPAPVTVRRVPTLDPGAPTAVRGRLRPGETDTYSLRLRRRRVSRGLPRPAARPGAPVPARPRAAGDYGLRRRLRQRRVLGRPPSQELWEVAEAGGAYRLRVESRRGKEAVGLSADGPCRAGGDRAGLGSAQGAPGLPGGVEGMEGRRPSGRGPRPVSRSPRSMREGGYCAEPPRSTTSGGRSSWPWAARRTRWRPSRKRSGAGHESAKPTRWSRRRPGSPRPRWTSCSSTTRSGGWRNP